MTYREINERFFRTFGNGKDTFSGKPVEALYRINREARENGEDDEVDESRLLGILKEFDLLKLIKG